MSSGLGGRAGSGQVGGGVDGVYTGACFLKPAGGKKSSKPLPDPKKCKTTTTTTTSNNNIKK